MNTVAQVMSTDEMRLPPQDEQAEQSVLGGMLLSKEAITDVLEVLAPTDFYRPTHQAVFTCILDVYGRGEPVDPITVSAELERRGELARIGGGPYLHTLVATVPTAVNAGYYADIVAEKATLRRLVEAGSRIAQLGYSGGLGADLDEVVDQARAAIDAATSQSPAMPQLADHRFDLLVADEARKLRAREHARRIVKREQTGAQGERPLIKLGTAFLAEPDDPVTYRISELWPVGGRIVLAAQYKAGKTTLMGNLVRSLVDGEPFLEHFTVDAVAHRVVIIDDELSEPMMRRWLRDQGIVHTDRFATVSLRGKLSTFDILDPVVRGEWAADIRALESDVAILDCLRPVLDALGLDENTDAGRFLVAFDELLNEAGISEAVVVHHMGHNGERSRGASRLRDWPDVEWRLVRQDTEDPASARYFSAYGRDVEVPEALLTYDSAGRRLTLAGGNRREAKGRNTLPAVLELLAGSPDGMSGRQIEEALTSAGETRQDVREALKLAVRDQLVVTFAGARRATMHVLRKT